MLPGGILAQAPAAVSVAVIVSGSVLVVLGATFGFVKIVWTGVDAGPFHGIIDPDDQQFRKFYREHRKPLLRFTKLMSGDPQAAQDLLFDASVQTRRTWSSGASEDPLGATLRPILSWVEEPAAWALARQLRDNRRSRWSRRGGGDRPLDPAYAEALAALPLQQRAALLLDSQLSLKVSQIAALLNRTEAEVERDVAAAQKTMPGTKAADAH